MDNIVMLACVTSPSRRGVSATCRRGILEQTHYVNALTGYLVEIELNINEWHAGLEILKKPY